MKQAKAKISPVKPKVPRIKHRTGTNRVLVIAPHGFKGNDDNTDILAEQLQERLDCFAVINTGFRRPAKRKGETSNPKNSLLDLGNISDGDQLRSLHEGMPHDEDFLGWIDSFLAEIAMNHGEPFVVHVHGIHDDSINTVASKTPYKDKPEDLHALIGYGQRNSKDQPTLTASKKTVADLIKSLGAEEINVIDAPVEKIEIDGDERAYCGSESYVLNQYLRKKKIKGQSIQLEIRESGFRDSPEIARKTAGSIGMAISLVAGIPTPAQKEAQDKKAGSRNMGAAALANPDQFEVRTTSSEKSEERRIRVKEIDLKYTRFRSRVSEYGVDEEKAKALVESIRSEGILNNIIVRRSPDKKSFQLISGWRRLAALERIYHAQGKKDEFQEAEVPARIYESLADDQALRISFSENLARKDLTLWELANHCRMIADELSRKGKSQGEIEERLALLINKDDRTVRRYLALSSIKNDDIRRDLHSGIMDAYVGTVFTRQGLTEKSREALYGIYKDFPNRLSFDSFDKLAKNALNLKDWSAMALEDILAIPTAKEFLFITPGELRERAEYLMSSRNKPLVEILANEIGYLKTSMEKVKSKDDSAPFTEKFSKKAAAIKTKISTALKTKKMVGDVAISPVGDLKDKMIKLSVAAPVSDIQKVAQLALKEMKDDIPSLERLFKKPPKPSPITDVAKAHKVKIDDNAAIAFTMRLKRLQGILKHLASDRAFYKYDDKDTRKDQVLVRAISDREVEFGRCLRGGLLIPCEAEVQRAASFALLFSGLYEQIAKLVVKEDTLGEIQIIPLRAKPSQDGPTQSTFSLRVQDTTYKWNLHSFEPGELSKYFDRKRTPKATLEIEALVLKDMLGRVMDCVNPDEVRTAMTGILFKMDAEKITMAGTNGVKTSEVVKTHNGFSGSAEEVLVPFHTGSLLAALIRRDTGIVRIRVSEEFVLFKLGGISLIGVPLREVKYPDYPPLFRRAENYFTIPIRKLKEFSDNLARFADPEDNHRLTIKTNGNLISFRTEKGKAEFSAAGAKGRMDLDMSAKSLSELARSMEGGEVEVRHSGTHNFITFHPDSGDQRALLTTVTRREPGKPQEKTQENKAPTKEG